MIYRELRPDEYELLKTFTYEAVFVPDGVEPPDRSIIELPELSMYYDGFGSGVADHCIVASDNDYVVGAVWVRIMNDYGHVDDDTPSLAISVRKDYRGQGIGTQLLRKMLGMLKSKGYERVSLTVQKANYAARMYRQAGFITISENDEEYIMLCSLN